jgi:hypothetical protein
MLGISLFVLFRLVIVVSVLRFTVSPLLSSNYSCYAVQNVTKLQVDRNER